MNKPELNPVARKWVAALRSGKIKQGRKQLGFTDGSRCCLGVLDDLAVEDGVIDGYDLSGAALLFKVRQWAGLTTPCGNYSHGCLALDNDNGKSFAEIADIIESQPDGLFVEQPEEK